MNLLGKIWATSKFDFLRSFQKSRISVFLVLMLFPPSIMAIIASFNEALEFAPAVIGVTVMMVGVLALLLWATPIVHQELEGKTWAYIAVRPEGRVAILIGKYLMSVTWTVAVCGISLTLCVAIVGLASPLTDLLRLWSVFFILICLASLAYGALFLLFGVLFHRRSMVLVVAYMILAEGLVANVPAIVNQFTIRHHLTALAIQWLDFDILPPEVVDQFLGLGEPTWQNVSILLVSPFILLAITIYVIVSREYITVDEN